MKQINRRYWHYTPAIRILDILASGKIKIDEQAKFYGEKSAAWVSTNPVWGPTATKQIMDKSGKIIPLTIEEMSQLMGLGRIEVSSTKEFVSWYKFRKTSGVHPALWKEMTKYGLQKGANPNEWFASFKPIIDRYFVSVEKFINGKWIKCDDWSKIEQFVSAGIETNAALLTNPKFVKTRKEAA